MEEEKEAKIVISYQGRKTMSFFGTSPRAPARGRVLKNSRFEPAVRILLFAAESKKLVQKGSFLRSVFETPWRKTFFFFMIKIGSPIQKAKKPHPNVPHHRQSSCSSSSFHHISQQFVECHRFDFSCNIRNHYQSLNYRECYSWGSS